MNHYPLIFKPIYKEMLWGGNRLCRLFGRDLPYEKTGESWDISCREGEMSVIENGPAAGWTLEEYIAHDTPGTLGTRLAGHARFPLLVKIIDANDNLSVQVHPDDAYACASGSTDVGKSEMWYILAPPTDGHLIIGLKPGITKEALRHAYESGTVESCLNYLPVSAGDIVDIPAGLIHALTPGVMVAEVQQNSDITYRLYDYNRTGLDGKPRQLHVDEALAVSDFESKIPTATVHGHSIKKGKNTLTYAITNQHFAIIKYDLHESYKEDSDPGAFCIYTAVEGDALILADTYALDLAKGRSAFIPAALGQYVLRPKNGRCVLIKSFVPDTTIF